MLDKVSQLAEQMATNASRRAFLGRFGRGAMTAAAALGGILALPGRGEAARKPPAICDGYSFSTCINQPVGSSCSGGREGGSGTCRQYRKSTTCFCG